MALLALAVSAALSAPVHADIATEHELFAGYCIGSLVVERDEPRDFGSSRGAAALSKDIAADFEALRARFAAYLTARGFGSARSTVASKGVMVAVAQGSADQRRCNLDIDSCTASCFQTATRDAESLVGCASACRKDSPACRSVDRCAAAGGPF